MLRPSTIVAILLFAAAYCSSGEFFVDPVNGTAAGNGSAEYPWQSLQEVVKKDLIESRKWDALPYKKAKGLVPRNAGAPIKGGDTIWLRSGEYGEVMILGYYNESPITIAAAEGHAPRFRSIHIRAGSHWILTGLHVSPEFGEGKKPGTLINLESHGWHGPVQDIVVEDCVLQSAVDTAAWSVDDWNKRTCNGINADGARSIVRRNHLKNVNFGITAGGEHSVVERNIVENFAGDGLRGLANHCTFQDNVVKNCYDVNGNHDDGFQSWSHTEEGVGTGEVIGMVLRGNTIINYEDPNQPHRGSLQGIGCFDGTFVDWVVENNIIVVDHWHGITLLGARNCRIVNNTVVDPNNERPGPARIHIGEHKTGTPPSGCVLRNNLASSIGHDKGEGMINDHNLILKSPETVFTDATKLDFSLKQGSPAIDAGSPEGAPETDIVGTPRPQGKAVDIGAFEWTPKP